MANPIALNNTDDNVSISVKNCDNQIEIKLSPDDPKFFGTGTVFVASGDGFATAPDAALPLNNYLRSLKSLNPNAKSVILTVISSNFAGGGSFSYSITGSGVSLAPVNYNLSTYTSQMDSYKVNLY
ncbi:hypothetical protein [Aliikangiella coralliicola]|uniref:Uncharacterized protein n=1 Tax=Aliikangiella coralliicola TaxID=2592383 RepID=A0A545UC04_9GAMM|nr:hypothetical protein [Aliikangiella coralliicola]TQV86994.1 hypothetical protein FLL46_14390 [Aliikangiella coralliicola]